LFDCIAAGQRRRECTLFPQVSVLRHFAGRHFSGEIRTDPGGAKAGQRKEMPLCKTSDSGPLAVLPERPKSAVSGAKNPK